MTHYAGLDVSVKETAICVIDAVGAVVWQGKVHTQIDTIAEALARHAPELERAGMETGPVAVWLWHGLRDAAVPLDCIHARRAAAALKLQVNKTDRNDAAARHKCRAVQQLPYRTEAEAPSKRSLNQLEICPRVGE